MRTQELKDTVLTENSIELQGKQIDGHFRTHHPICFWQLASFPNQRSLHDHQRHNYRMRARKKKWSGRHYVFASLRTKVLSLYSIHMHACNGSGRIPLTRRTKRKFKNQPCESRERDYFIWGMFRKFCRTLFFY
jgi:hypothetical protein